MKPLRSPLGGLDRRVAKLLLEARRFALSRNLVSGSYRIVPSFHSQLAPGAILCHFGFPPAWVELYDRDPDFRRHDPIADFVIRAGVAMSWNQAIKAQRLTKGQTSFVEAMKAHGLVHGMAAPIYGPHGREAYITFSFGREIGSDEAHLVDEILGYAQTLHARIARLTSNAAHEIAPFSQREKEVLVWIARGKSNGDIATILGLSSSTVGTYVRRVFRKLEVNDRMTATIKGLQEGIVRL